MESDRLFELRRRTFDTPRFRGIELIEVEAKTIINHVPGRYLPFNWTINPYRGCSHACTYCFARSTHTYMDMNAGRDFETKIVVKVNAPELLGKELRSKRWTGEHIAMGTATDPYQRAEGRYKITKRIIETLLTYRNPFSVLTKGTLILRDLDLLADAAGVTDVSTAFSIPTLDEQAWSHTEPGTPHPRKRMEAVRKLNEAGVRCGVMVAPILPGITDDVAGMKEVVEAAVDSGATYVTSILLHLRPGVKEVYMSWLGETYPELVPRYEAMYPSAYAPKAEQKAVARRVAGMVRAAGGLEDPQRRRVRPESQRRTARDHEPRESQQLKLL